MCVGALKFPLIRLISPCEVWWADGGVERCSADDNLIGLRTSSSLYEDLRYAEMTACWLEFTDCRARGGVSIWA